MRVINQRVKSSQVQVNGEIIGKIGCGLNLLVGIANTDESELDWMARKCLELRLFPDSANDGGRWDKSVEDIGGELLVLTSTPTIKVRGFLTKRHRKGAYSEWGWHRD